MDKMQELHICHGQSLLEFESSFFLGEEDSLTCYIHDLSPVKKARSGNTEYYNFTVQTKQNVHQGVSFRMDLRDKLEKATEEKSPVKLKNFKRKVNWKDNSQQDIEINRNTKIEDSQAGFPHKKIKRDIAKQLKIKSILDNSYDRQAVTVVGFINIDSMATSAMDVNGDTKRTDVFINDDSGIILLSLWNEKGNNLKSGVYEIQNAVVRELSNTSTGFFLTTTNETSLTPSKHTVKKMPPPFELKTKVKFPIKTVVISHKNLKCPLCFASVDEKTSGNDFFQCSKCKASCKHSSLPIHFTIKIITEEGQEVVMYMPQLYQNLKNKGVLMMRTRFVEFFSWMN